MRKSGKINYFLKMRKPLSSTIVDEEKVMNTKSGSITFKNSTVILKQSSIPLQPSISVTPDKVMISASRPTDQVIVTASISTSLLQAKEYPSPSVVWSVARSFSSNWCKCRHWLEHLVEKDAAAFCSWDWWNLIENVEYCPENKGSSKDSPNMLHMF